ncbi:MAG: alanyl-tRNA editing protein [Clostridia bacterium]|nr:alanyl-tRNA editing protein [Clostridia bacterium]
MTKKLFEENAYLKTCQAKVVLKDGLKYYFDQTVFFPEGGGQSADKGTINNIEVLDVRETENGICHILASELHDEFVEMVIDWEKRFDEMQQHCGEHILSGVIFDHYQGKNKGFHIGKDYVTIDIDHEIKPEMLIDIENLANQAIYDNIELNFEYMSDDKAYFLRKEPTVEENVRIVTIPGVDCVACCGTHPTRTGEVGIVKLYKVEKNKGLSRIFFKCGKRALIDLQEKTNIVQYFNRQYSSDDSTLVERFEKEKEKNEILKKKYIQLHREAIEKIINEQMSQDAVQYFSFEDLSGQGMNDVIKSVSEKGNYIILIYSILEHKVMLSHDGSHNLHCGQLFKSIRDYNGKGGGNQKTAQGVFESSEDAEKFIAYVKGELRS